MAWEKSTPWGGGGSVAAEAVRREPAEEERRRLLPMCALGEAMSGELSTVNGGAGGNGDGARRACCHGRRVPAAGLVEAGREGGIR